MAEENIYQSDRTGANIDELLDWADEHRNTRHVTEEDLETKMNEVRYAKTMDAVNTSLYREHGFFIDGTTFSTNQNWDARSIAVPSGAASVDLANISIPATGGVVAIFLGNSEVKSVVKETTSTSIHGVSRSGIIVPYGADTLIVNTSLGNVATAAFFVKANISEDMASALSDIEELQEENEAQQEDINDLKEHGLLPLVAVEETRVSTNLLNPTVSGWILNKCVNTSGTYSAGNGYGSIELDVSSYPVGTKFYAVRNTESTYTCRRIAFLTSSRAKVSTSDNVTVMEKATATTAILIVSIYFTSVFTETNFSTYGLFAVLPTETQAQPAWEAWFAPFIKKYTKKADDYNDDDVEDGDALAFKSDLEGFSPVTTHELTVGNADKIAIIGDSYTESHFTVKGKAYISKMSLFSDYNFVNFGKSGDIYSGRLYDIRNNTAHYGSVTFAQWKPKYAMMCCFTNDVKYMNINSYIQILQDAVNVIRGFGTEPIICTEYHTNFNASDAPVRSALRFFAKKNGLLFWDLASYCDYVHVNGTSYAPFWGDTHPGTRTNEMESDGYNIFLKGLDRPMRSLKLFRTRETADLTNLDSLMFSTNEERARLYKEILVGHSALNNNALVDSCARAANSRVNDEYAALIGGSAVAFDKVCLASAVLPLTAGTLSDVSLKINATGTNLKVYVKNKTASPFPSPTRYTRFDFNSINTEPAVGSTYTASNGASGTTYTVVAVTYGDADGSAIGSIFCSPSDSSTNDAGTLTKASGTGDATIAFSYRAVGYLSGDAAADTCGHWTELTEESTGVYPISAALLNSAVDLDRIDFLIAASSSINLTGVSVMYKGEETKKTFRTPVGFETNELNGNDELFPASRFGAAGSADANWGVTPTRVYEQTTGSKAVYPKGCVSKVTLTDMTALECTVPSSKMGGTHRKAVLELWCRYFPPVYTNGGDGQITEDSFDYNEVYVDMGRLSNKTRTTWTMLKGLVGLHWKILRFPLYLNGAADVKFKIYSNTEGVEIAYASLKYTEAQSATTGNAPTMKNGVTFDVYNTDTTIPIDSGSTTSSTGTMYYFKRSNTFMLKVGNNYYSTFAMYPNAALYTSSSGCLFICNNKPYVASWDDGELVPLMSTGGGVESVARNVTTSLFTSVIWVGTQSQYDDLSAAQKAAVIAFIVEE